MFGSAFLGPNGPGSDATPGEHVAFAIACLFFPTALSCAVLFAGLDATPAVWVALGTIALSFVIARRLSDRLSFALLTTFLGAVWTFVGVGTALLLAGLADFYQNF